MVAKRCIPRNLVEVSRRDTWTLISMQDRQIDYASVTSKTKMIHNAFDLTLKLHPELVKRGDGYASDDAASAKSELFLTSNTLDIVKLLKTLRKQEKMV